MLSVIRASQPDIAARAAMKQPGSGDARLGEDDPMSLTPFPGQSTLTLRVRISRDSPWRGRQWRRVPAGNPDPVVTGRGIAIELVAAVRIDDLALRLRQDD